MQYLLLAAASTAFRLAPTIVRPAPLTSTTNDWQQFEVDAWRDAVVAFDDDEDEDFELFLDDLDGDLEETPPPRDDAPRYLREAVEVCGADVALEGLTARERDVLEARYWSEAPRTQLDAANELDVSLTRVNNLERSARKKLERLLEERRSMAQTDADVSDDDGLSDAAQRALAEGRLMLGVMERRVGYFYFRDELGLDEATLGRGPPEPAPRDVGNVIASILTAVGPTGKAFGMYSLHGLRDLLLASSMMGRYRSGKTLSASSWDMLRMASPMTAFSAPS